MINPPNTTTSSPSRAAPSSKQARLARLREEAEPLVAGERRIALRALLQTPLLTADAHGTVFALVRRTSELWTPAERTALTGFLQNRIRAEQTANENGSWRDRLTTALDYRRWHRFVVERQQDGIWRRLDKRTYGTGSGGEKALALTLPRFAAAAAHYRSARADAPGLVMLDEAFAGIDPTLRAQCMGVLAQFDLDVVMTSENEWGCYPTVPGLAIYHLNALDLERPRTPPARRLALSRGRDGMILNSAIHLTNIERSLALISEHGSPGRLALPALSRQRPKSYLPVILSENHESESRIG